MTQVSDKRDQLELALEVGAAVSSSLELDDVLSTIARRLTELFDVWECNVYEYRPLEGTLLATALWAREITVADQSWAGTVVDIAERPRYRELIEIGGVHEFQLDDPGLDPAHLREMQEWHEQTNLSVPLIFNDEAIGLLTLVEKRWRRCFTAEERRLLAQLAVPAAVAIHNARMFRREAQQNRRLRALVDAGRAISSTLDLDRLLQTVAQAAGEALGTAECAIDSYDARERDHQHRRLLPARRGRPGRRWVGRTDVLSERLPQRSRHPLRRPDPRGERLRPDARRSEPPLHDRERGEDDHERPARGRRPADRPARLRRDRGRAALHARRARDRRRSGRAGGDRDAQRADPGPPRRAEPTPRFAARVDEGDHLERRPRGSAADGRPHGGRGPGLPAVPDTGVRRRRERRHRGGDVHARSRPRRSRVAARDVHARR